MKITHQETENKGRFFIKEAEEQLAEMTYVWSGETRIIIDHTEVSEKLKGQGIGKQLVEEAIHFACAKNIKILPLCPFAKKVMERNADYNDVLF